MKQKTVYRALVTGLCLLLAVLACLSAIGIYREGAARRAEDPLAAIYTPENVGAALLRLVPLGGILLIASIAGNLLGLGSEAKGRPAAATPPPKPAKPWLKWALIAVAALMIVLGALNGSAQDVLVKAVNICTECIGLG